MFYRRKIILALLQIFGNELNKVSLQKLMFLLSKLQVKPDYDFVPYKFGCYSFSLNADLTTMVKKEFLCETGNSFSRVDRSDIFKSLKKEDQTKLLEVRTFYGNMSPQSLMKHTYKNFPYWAINSTVAEKILSQPELDAVRAYKPVVEKVSLYTIGYEQISLEEYLNRLIQNDVKLLVDVRRNPLSMKFGFSKSQLKKYCESLNIDYIHFPELGIHSDERQQLNIQEDYDKLFTVYKEKTLSSTIDAQKSVATLLRKYERIALTCFEANICQCHRKHLAEAITRLPNSGFEIKHI